MPGQPVSTEQRITALIDIGGGGENLSLGSHDSGGLWILVPGSMIDEGGQAAVSSDLQPT